jgi:hypothetical protein
VSTTTKLRRAAHRKRRWMRRHRLRRQVHAFAGRYFWLPCPLCGEESGGHEWIGRIVLPRDSGTPGVEGGTGVCPACELDLGAQAAAICDREGHRLVTVCGGGRVPFVRDDEGNCIGSMSIDLSSPTAVYCATCGIDLPVPGSAGVDNKGEQ